jgi:hypothetical protein
MIFKHFIANRFYPMVRLIRIPQIGAKVAVIEIAFDRFALGETALYIFNFLSNNTARIEFGSVATLINISKQANKQTNSLKRPW